MIAQLSKQVDAIPGMECSCWLLGSSNAWRTSSVAFSRIHRCWITSHVSSITVLLYIQGSLSSYSRNAMFKLSPKVRMNMSILMDVEALLFSMSSFTTSSLPQRIIVWVPILTDTIGPSEKVSQRGSDQVDLGEYLAFFCPFLELGVQILSRELVQIAQDWNRWRTWPAIRVASSSSFFLNDGPSSEIASYLEDSP